jgi:hypothetical protein
MMEDLICYCFAYTAEDIEDDVRSNGPSTILDKSLRGRRQMKLFKVPHNGASPGVVGVLVKVPVMLTLCDLCNRSHHWFAR